MMKTRQDKKVTDCIGLVDTEFEIEWSIAIRSGVVCDENHTRQRCN